MIADFFRKSGRLDDVCSRSVSRSYHVSIPTQRREVAKKNTLSFLCVFAPLRETEDTLVSTGYDHCRILNADSPSNWMHHEVPFARSVFRLLDT